MRSDIDVYLKQRPSWLMILSLVVVVLTLIVGGSLGLNRMRQRAAALEAHSAPPTASATALPTTPEVTATPFPDNAEGAEPPPAATPLPAIRRSLSRITVLLLGSDVRPEEDGPWQTDTIMLLTLDPQTWQAGVLSIPRDLWVPIPDHPNGRINTAYYLGDVGGYPGGGAALALETVRQNLGVSVDHYVRVDFQGFVELVDLIGGIAVNVERAIDDPNYPFVGPDGETVYDRLYIEAGPQHFDGDMALKYARTRYSTGDIDRTRRQQQILRVVLKRVTDLRLLPELLNNAPEIYTTLQASVQTDMSLDVIGKLATQALQVERANIRFRVIDDTCVRPWTTPDGGQVLLPLWDNIRPLRDEVFGVSAPSATPQ